MLRSADVAASRLAKFEKNGKENVLRRERKREREKATAEISMEAFMNETVFPVTLPIRMSRGERSRREGVCEVKFTTI